MSTILIVQKKTVEKPKVKSTWKKKTFGRVIIRESYDISAGSQKWSGA